MIKRNVAIISVFLLVLMIAMPAYSRVCFLPNLECTNGDTASESSSGVITCADMGGTASSACLLPADADNSLECRKEGSCYFRRCKNKNPYFSTKSNCMAQSAEEGYYVKCTSNKYGCWIRTEKELDKNTCEGYDLEYPSGNCCSACKLSSGAVRYSCGNCGSGNDCFGYDIEAADVDNSCKQCYQTCKKSSGKIVYKKDNTCTCTSMTNRNFNIKFSRTLDLDNNSKLIFPMIKINDAMTLEPGAGSHSAMTIQPDNKYYPFMVSGNNKTNVHVTALTGNTCTGYYNFDGDDIIFAAYEVGGGKITCEQEDTSFQCDFKNGKKYEITVRIGKGTMSSLPINHPNCGVDILL